MVRPTDGKGLNMQVSWALLSIGRRWQTGMGVTAWEERETCVLVPMEVSPGSAWQGPDRRGEGVLTEV